MKRVLLFVFLLATFAPANAQLSPGRLAQDKYLANGVHHSYDPGMVVDTPAPRGYKPFYISHAGRHGSRYDLGEGENFILVTDLLAKAGEKGLLTAEGRSLLQEVSLMKEASEGMWEMLTQRGCREHRQIAARMMKRFPAVFSSRKRKEVDAVSSTVPRCILSMANFLLEVSRERPGLEIRTDTGDKYMRYLMHWDSRNRARQTTVRPDSDRYLEENLDPGRICGALFTDPAAALGDCPPYRFLRALFVCTSFTETLDMEQEVDLYRYFTLDELYVLATDQSDRFYTQNANSLLYGDSTALQGKRLLKDFVVKADAAVAEGSARAADLRFTHDTALLPFATLIGFSGMDKKALQTEAHYYWYSGDMIPMGSNYQLVFYRKGDDILVKMLYNEKERTVPALTPVTGPYYRWTDLRAYFARLCEGADL